MFLNDNILKQVDKFNYLGSLVTVDGRYNDEINVRTAQANTALQNMKRILSNKRVSLEVRYDCSVI